MIYYFPNLSHILPYFSLINLSTLDLIVFKWTHHFMPFVLCYHYMYLLILKERGEKSPFLTKSARDFIPMVMTHNIKEREKKYV